MNFKEWVVSHNPQLDWNFNDYEILHKQLCDNIKVSGYLDLRTVFRKFLSDSKTGLTLEQDNEFFWNEKNKRAKK